jgi:hypothetical protein
LVASSKDSNQAQGSLATNKRGASREGLTDVVGCKRERVATNNRRGSERRRGVGLTNIPTFLAEASPITPAQAAESNISYPHHGVGSYCPHSSHIFAVEIAGQVVRAVEGYVGGVMEVRAYTPPYDEGCFPAGFLVLTLMREGRPPVRFGIEFGQRDEGGGYVREGFDVDAWSEEPCDPHAGGIYAVNFDEAWRIVCLVGSSLRPGRVTLNYGS